MGDYLLGLGSGFVLGICFCAWLQHWVNSGIGPWR